MITDCMTKTLSIILFVMKLWILIGTGKTKDQSMMQNFKGFVEQVGLLLRPLLWSQLIRSRLENWSAFLSSKSLIVIALVLVAKVVTLLMHLNTQKLLPSCLISIIHTRGPLERSLIENAIMIRQKEFLKFQNIRRLHHTTLIASEMQFVSNR